MNRYVVFAARSGSTYYSKWLAEDIGATWLGDIMHSHSEPLEDWQHIKQLGKSNYVAKVSSWHWEKLSGITNTDIMQELIQLGDEFIFLIRKDYQKQLESFYAALLLEKEYNYTFGCEFEEQILLKFSVQDFWYWHSVLKHRYEKNAQLFHTLSKSKRIVFFEDFARDEEKYMRNYCFDKTAPTVNFNPLQLFGL
jgi:hypothetical protein